MKKSIWIFAQMSNGNISDVTYELLGEGKRLAGNTYELAVLIAGTKEDIKANVDELFSHGAEKVYAAGNEYLKTYTAESYTDALETVIRTYEPEILIFGATALGRDLAPKLASRLDTGMTSDCTRLDIDDREYLEYILSETAAKEENILTSKAEGLLKATKPAFGGNLLATIYAPSAKPQMASVRPGVFDKAVRRDNAAGEVIWTDVDIKEEDIHVHVKGIKPEEGKGPDLAAADIVVAGGRGLVDEEGFELLKEFAQLIGAEVGVSRSLVDNGWADVSMQIGQSGVTIAPRLYINFGISGVVQHTAGILGSECIVSVNSDDKAPIFEVSDYCIVGDSKECLRQFISRLK